MAVDALATHIARHALMPPRRKTRGLGTRGGAEVPVMAVRERTCIRCARNRERLCRLHDAMRMGIAMAYEPSQVRAWAQRAGMPVGTRGRLSYEVVTAYLVAHPSVARELASELGITISSRGKVSQTACEELATFVR